MPDGRVIFDDLSSPWHTVCEIDAPDTPGLLAALTTVFAAAGVEIKAASVGRSDGRAVDRFELTGRHGPCLVPDERDRIVTYLGAGVSAKPRRWWRGFVVSSPEPV